MFKGALGGLAQGTDQVSKVLYLSQVVLHSHCNEVTVKMGYRLTGPPIHKHSLPPRAQWQSVCVCNRLQDAPQRLAEAPSTQHLPNPPPLPSRRMRGGGAADAWWGGHHHLQVPPLPPSPHFTIPRLGKYIGRSFTVAGGPNTGTPSLTALWVLPTPHGGGGGLQRVQEGGGGGSPTTFSRGGQLGTGDKHWAWPGPAMSRE